MENDLPFRPCVGIALFSQKGDVFVGERIDTPGAWQLPQGGIDPGETPEQAFFRELREEVGTDKAEIVEIMARPLRYALPPHLLGNLWDGKWGGQEQTWIAARFSGTDSDIAIDAHDPPEFRAWKWVPLGSILDVSVSFKKDTYRKVIETFRPHALRP